MTDKHIAADIKNRATSGSNPNTFRIERSLIYFWMDEIRAMLIAQAIQKGQDISDIWIQPITCLDLIEVDKSECCEVETNCTILRTELQLPNTIETKGDNSIIRVVDNNGNTISKSNVFSSKYDGYSKYSTKTTKWYSKNNYIYIFNTSEEALIDQINVYGIWDRPRELSNFVTCNGSTCYTPGTTDYPCSIKMANDISDIILKTKIYPFLQVPQDNTNNSNDKPDLQLPNKI